MFDQNNFSILVRDTGPGRKRDAPYHRNGKDSASFPCWRRDNEAEAYVVVPVVRVVPVAIRGTQVPGVVVPGAAADHAVGAAYSPIPLVISLSHSKKAINTAFLIFKTSPESVR